MLREDDLLNENLEGYHVTGASSFSALKSTFLGESISSATSGPHVNIELFPATRVSTQQEQQDILQKISSLQQLHYPYILPILAFGIHKDAPYVITEYLNSGTLYGHLQNREAEKPMQLEETVLTLTQIGLALHYAHQQHVVHGYLQPQNVLFDPQGEALLTGFHLRLLLLPDEMDDSNTQEESIYWAPEHLLGQISEKSDQYALGCIAYEMFTGHKAFMVQSVSNPGAYYRTKSLIAPRRLNPALPPSLERAILKAMAQEPDHRFQDIAAFLAALGIASIENRNLKETAGIFQQITLADFDDLPDTPVPGIDKHETIKTPIPGIDKHETIKVPVPRHETSANWSYTEASNKEAPEIVESIKPIIVLSSEPMHVIDAYKSQGKQTGLKIPQFNKFRKGVLARPQRTVAVIAILVAIILLFSTIALALNGLGPAKTTGKTVRTIQVTVAYPPVQTHTTVIVPGMRPSKTGTTTASSKNATPVTPLHNPVPTLIPSKTPVSGATPGATPGVTPTVAPPTQSQVSLSAFFNNSGIGNGPGQANFDGARFSYPANQLPLGNQITVQGVTYQFPSNGPGNNISASGQTISLTTGNYKQAFLLASSAWGPINGTVMVQYTDGSTGATQITVPDWVAGPSGAVNTSYRYSPNGIDYNSTHLYAIAIPLDNTRTVNTLTLPRPQFRRNQNGRIHVFALTLQP